MAKYKTSDGEWIDKVLIDSRILKSKKEYSQFFYNRHGYYFCERCKKNESGCPGISRSHIISVDECQNSGRSELAYDITIYEHLGKKCHDKIEAWSHKKREAWYWARLNQYTFEEFIEAYKGANILPRYMRSFQGIREQIQADI